MHSALYEGWVRHRRFAPVRNDFRYSVYMTYLDLDELDHVFRKRLFWSTREFNLAWFKRDDYLTAFRRSGQPLCDAVRELVETRTGARPLGPIRLLTNLRHFGFGMNPVSFYYCFNPDGESLHSIIAEINNTPWNEQHDYVFACGYGTTRPLTPDPSPPRGDGNTRAMPHRFQFHKEFHVSPFIDMAVRYDWRFNTPGRRLAVHMIDHKPGGAFFDSTLLLTRREISTRSLASALARHPFITMKVFAAIYFQAARLWLKSCPIFTHPKWSSLENSAP
ncbi:MAG TPA: DUF1365 domain-containing protein [Planctomycetota bacterium]|nr:DUF1365 domain-containing protein [Planctomycetota bacterium]